MSYIIKNTSGLINTRVTDVGRRRISQGNFNISYFQIGDSEVSYTAVPNYNQVNNNILMPAFCAQNDRGTPQSNKQNIKYPYYVNGGDGNTYGIPFQDSGIDEVFNAAGSKGFFTYPVGCSKYDLIGDVAGTTIFQFIPCGGSTPIPYSIGNTQVTVCVEDSYGINIVSGPGTYTYVGICATGSTPWIVNVASAYTVNSNYWVDMTTLSGQTDIIIDLNICSPTTGTPEVNEFVTIYLDGNGGCFDIGTVPILTYKIQSITAYTNSYGITLDRAVPNYTANTSSGQYARVQVYPSGMTQLYDTVTPYSFWQLDTLNFESPCDVSNRENTVIWNMNIPWTESPAGLFSSTYEDYSKFGSETYVGTKEYLGYNEITGQTDTSEVFYYNSFDEKITVKPYEQKAVAIIHYTNQDIDFVYGEKFATEPFDPQNPTDDVGLARHFKLSLPTLMWHKTTGTTIGADFYIDPENYDLCKPYYIKSNENSDMNDPGIRYYHLWDINPDLNENLNRIGKVFPDQQIVIIDDEEIVASMSYKSNRNWTLPAPKISLITPNTCFSNNQTATGIMTSTADTMWVTYRFDNTGFTNSLHCNYYSSILGPDTGCTTSSQNVAIRFGAEFPFLTQGSLSGFSANKLQILCQKRTDTLRPDPTQWKMIDVTDMLSATTINGFLTMSGITGTTFEISTANYNAASLYSLSNYINLAPNGSPDVMNFGDEYYFYGNIETDIMATIYEMRFLCNLGRNQFSNTSNPTWTSGTTSYVTEIGLFNEQKELLVVSKLQSPELRQGIQQFVVKLDF